MRVRPGFNTRELIFSRLRPDPRTYRYSPLPSPTSLRLLKVQSDIHGPIRCSLQIFDIKDAPPFDALSYTWGYPLIPSSTSGVSASFKRLAFLRRAATVAPRLVTVNGQHAFSGEHPTDHTSCFPISCDGLMLHVTANLNDALNMLGKDTITGLARQKYLWIDALCIDQDNVAERNQQVALMAEIFKTAQSVITWLGDEDEFSQDAFTVIEQIASSPEDKWSSVPYTGFYNGDQCYVNLGIKPLSYFNWLGFLGFIDRRWFKRAWVVQELSLARSAVLVCGTKALPWQLVSRTLDFIRTTRWYHHLSTEKMRHIAELQRSPGIYCKFLESKTSFDMASLYLNRTRRIIHSSKEKNSSHSLSLNVLMNTHRNTETTDPRDKVYAFLGLANRRMRPFTLDHNPISPDYEISVQQVFTQAAQALLLSYQDLSLLSHVQDPSISKVKDLPSWVPDYTVELQPYPLEFRGACNWSASGDMRWNHVAKAMESVILPVDGFLVDRIQETATMPYEATDIGESWASIVRVASKQNDHYPHPSCKGTPLSRIEVLWRTLTTNTYARKHPAPPECGELFIDYILNLQIRHRLAPWSTDIDFQPHHTPTSELTNPAWHDLLAAEPPGSPYGAELYRRRFSAVVENMFKGTYSPIGLAQLQHEIDIGSGNVRRLFRTQGMLLGTGAKSVQAGDEVWILAGAKVPFILRRISEGRHRLIGEAYVHGIMHGSPLRFGLELAHTELE